MKRWTREAAPILAGFSVRKCYFREAVVQHQEHEINVALSGEGVYRLSRRERLTLAAGEILLLPAGLRHGIEVPRGLRMAATRTGSAGRHRPRRAEQQLPSAVRPRDGDV